MSDPTEHRVRYGGMSVLPIALLNLPIPAVPQPVVPIHFVVTTNQGLPEATGEKR
jgi:hypothetical protein